MSEEIARGVILVVVLLVAVVRSPFMVRDSRQRLLLSVLVVFLGGSIVIQSWFGVFVNALTGITHFNNLVQGGWGVLNAAVMLELVASVVHDERKARQNRLVRILWAVATVVVMVVCFALTPGVERFNPRGIVSIFAVYAVVAGIYMIAAAGSAAWLLVRRLPYITGRTLYTGLLMVTVGNTIQVPFMVIRTLQRLIPDLPSELLTTAFVLNTTRFIMVPLGCVIAALEPPRKAALYWYRRVRLYTLWRGLRDATEELALTPPEARTRDLLTVSDAWERLHRRVIEIHDSAFYLFDAWVWPELLVEAKRRADQAARSGQCRIVAVAYWLEVARRVALSGVPRLHSELNRELLPELQAAESTMHAEMQYLIRLNRSMRSQPVQAFAKEAVEKQRQISKS